MPKNNKLGIVMVFFSIIIVLFTGYVQRLYKDRKTVQEEPLVIINDMTGIRINELILAEDKTEEVFMPTFNNVHTLETMGEYQKYLYTIDKTAYVEQKDLDIKSFTAMDLKTNIRGVEPRILIFHTHSQEDFIDSRPGMEEDTIIGIGDELSRILVEEYGVPVVHDVGRYDLVNGKVERGRSYETMEPAVKKILEKYPSIEVTIDLHRDGVPDNVHLMQEIDGKPTAKIMFFNGMTRENINGRPKEIPELFNPHLRENLALSMQAFLHANEMYPGFARKIYIKPYRYSLHLMPKSMLVEAGANTNTVAEVKNAMRPLAEILVKTLSAD